MFILTHRLHLSPSFIGYITGSMSDFLTTLRKIWFDFYPRSSHTTHLDTSGFEHVFVGETTSTKVDGFHNWIQYYLEEKRGNLKNLGFVYTKQVLKMKTVVCLIIDDLLCMAVITYK